MATTAEMITPIDANPVAAPEHDEEILVLAANGYTALGTANLLHTSVGSVKADLRRIGVEDQVDAVAACMRLGLLH